MDGEPHGRGIGLSRLDPVADVGWDLDPAVIGFEFVVADKPGKRSLVIRDGQHEYIFTEG